MKTLPRLAVLASHEGTNLQALLNACKDGTMEAEPVLVISNNRESGALQRARRAGVPAVHLSRRTCGQDAQQLDRQMCECLDKYGAQWVILAGYMRPVGQRVLHSWRDHIVNIHPGKLPEFGGKGMYGAAVHAAVLRSKATATTITVHYVDEIYDHGQVIAEQAVPVLPGDTPHSLGARVQKEEHRFYPRTIAELLRRASPAAATGTPQPA